MVYRHRLNVALGRVLDLDLEATVLVYLVSYVDTYLTCFSRSKVSNCKLGYEAVLLR